MAISKHRYTRYSSHSKGDEFQNGQQTAATAAERQ